ncbi:ww domain containing protein [Stylonychia lemnae]|uniref:Ww domain containing protein n=1 Tax=Stylonychia lemnae TaxID=5949 RepID=A0A077ZZP1_STYLE|nr:ww domain containing protein [Stylonychia lemnae]|eukprot:CDW75355.1 ww domain containing protein [Stylonychia lemnae]
MMDIGFDLETDKNSFIWYLKQILIAELPTNWQLETDDQNQELYYNILTKEVVEKHPMIPQYRQIFMRLLQMKKLRNVYQKEGLNDMIISAEQKKAILLKRWQENKIIEDSYDVNLVGTSLKLTNARLSDKEKIIEELQNIYRQNKLFYDKQLTLEILSDLKDFEYQEKVNVQHIIENALYYGVNIGKEPQLAWIGHLPNLLDLPPNWRKVIDKDRNDVKYVNVKTLVEMINHPADLYIYNLIEELRNYYKNHQREAEEIQLLASTDGLMRRFTANLSAATKQYQEFLDDYNRKLKKLNQKYKPKKYSKKNSPNRSPNSSMTANGQTGMLLRQELKKLKDFPPDEEDLAPKVYTPQPEIEVQEDEVADIFKRQEQQLFEIASQCSIEIEKEIYLLFALENIIIQQRYSYYHETWQFRVSRDKKSENKTNKVWWLNLKSSESSKQYPFLEEAKKKIEEFKTELSGYIKKQEGQVKTKEEISQFFVGPKGDTILQKVVEQRLKMTEQIINARLKKQAIIKDINIKQSNMHIILDTSDSELSDDAVSKMILKRRGSLSRRTSRAELEEVAEFVTTYLNGNFNTQEIKDLIFYCPFKLYKDLLKDKVLLIQRNFRNSNMELNEDNTESLASVKSSDYDTDHISEQLSLMKKFKNDTNQSHNSANSKDSQGKVKGFNLQAMKIEEGVSNSETHTPHGGIKLKKAFDKFQNAIDVVDVDVPDNQSKNFDRAEWPAGMLPSNYVSSQGSFRQNNNSSANSVNKRLSERNRRRMLGSKEKFNSSDVRSGLNGQESSDKKLERGSLGDKSQYLTVKLFKRSNTRDIDSLDRENSRRIIDFSTNSRKESNQNIINIKEQDSIDQQSLDSLINRPKLSPNYQNEGESNNSPALSQQSLSPDQIIKNILNDSRIQKELALQKLEMIRTQKQKNKLETVGKMFASDVHIVYNKSQSLLQKEVHYKVLKQIQGVDAKKYKDDEKQRIQEKYSNQREKLQREMRMNFITSKVAEIKKSQENSQDSGTNSSQDDYNDNMEDYQNLDQYFKIKNLQKRFEKSPSNENSNAQSNQQFRKQSTINLKNMVYMRNGLRNKRSSQKIDIKNLLQKRKSIIETKTNQPNQGRNIIVLKKTRDLQSPKTIQGRDRSNQKSNSKIRGNNLSSPRKQSIIQMPETEIPEQLRTKTTQQSRSRSKSPEKNNHDIIDYIQTVRSDQVQISTMKEDSVTPFQDPKYEVTPRNQKVDEGSMEGQEEERTSRQHEIVKRTQISPAKRVTQQMQNKNLKTPVSIKFTSTRHLFSRESGLDTKRSTAALTFRNSSQAQQFDTQTIKDQCHKFFEHSFDNTQDLRKIQGFNQEFSRIRAQSGYLTQRTTARPSTDIGQARAKLINMKSSMSNRKKNYYNYYKEILGDPSTTELANLNFQETISGVDPIHVFQMGLRLGIIDQIPPKTFKCRDNINSKSNPDLLWIAQQALIIKTPPESFPQSFYLGTFDVYHSLSTLNVGLHPGDTFFRELVENIQKRVDYSKFPSSQVIQCSWLFFKDHYFQSIDEVASEQSAVNKGYYFNMITQKQNSGDQIPRGIDFERPRTSIQVNNTISLRRVKSGFLTQRGTIRNLKNMGQKSYISPSKDSPNRQALTDRGTRKSSIKSKYLQNIKSKIEGANKYFQELKIKHQNFKDTLPSYAPLSSNQFQIQRKMSQEFTKKPKEEPPEHQVKMNNEIIAQKLSSFNNHNESQNESSFHMKTLIKMPKQYVYKSNLTPFQRNLILKQQLQIQNQKQPQQFDKIPELRIEEINLHLKEDRLCMFDLKYTDRNSSSKNSPARSLKSQSQQQQQTQSARRSVCKQYISKNTNHQKKISEFSLQSRNSDFQCQTPIDDFE